MDKKKYEQVVQAVIRAKFAKSVKDMLKDAEAAWQAQRTAISLIDIRNDELKGEKELMKLVVALNAWLIDLEVLTYDSQKIAKRANLALHAGGGYDEPQEDGEALGDNEEGGQVAGSNGKVGAFDGRRGGRRHWRHRAAGNGNKSGSKVIHQGIGTGFEDDKKISGGEH